MCVTYPDSLFGSYLRWHKLCYCVHTVFFSLPKFVSATKTQDFMVLTQLSQLHTYTAADVIASLLVHPTLFWS